MGSPHSPRRVTASERTWPHRLSILLLLHPGAAFAQEVVSPTTVVSASRVPVPSTEVGSALTLIPQERIEASGTTFVSDLLRQAPGVAVSSQGGFGKATQVRMRGAEGNHTLVLIDGVEANDPAANSEFFFDHLLAGNTESIEVLRGPQSALYGSDALGGVISLNSRRATQPFEADLFAEGGSFDSGQAGAFLGRRTDDYDFGIGGQWLDTGGTNVSRFGSEEDGYSNHTYTAAGGLKLGPLLRLDASLRYTDARSEFDAQDFAFPATPTEGLVIDTDNVSEATRLYATLQANLDLLDGRWQHRLRASRTQSDTDEFQDGSFVSSSAGGRTKYDYQTTLFFSTPALAGGEHSATFAYEDEKQTFETDNPFADQDRDNRQNSFVAEYRVGLFDRLFLSAGGRHDNNQLFDDADTYRLTAAFLVPASATRLHASYGTAVTNPGFFELYGFIPSTFVGNPDLEPEHSRGYDVGIEQAWFDRRLVVDVTYFKADLEDEIATVFDLSTFTFSVENDEGRSRRKGWEVTAAAALTDALRIDASYTYTDSEDPDGQREVRRPRHVASVNALWTFLAGRGRVNLGIDYTGEQEDSEFVSATPQDRVTLPAYTLVRLAAAYSLTRNLSLFGRIENLLDVDYEEVYSYTQPGIGAFAGLRLTLP